LPAPTPDAGKVAAVAPEEHTDVVATLLVTPEGSPLAPPPPTTNAFGRPRAPTLVPPGQQTAAQRPRKVPVITPAPAPSTIPRPGSPPRASSAGTRAASRAEAASVRDPVRDDAAKADRAGSEGGTEGSSIVARLRQRAGLENTDPAATADGPKPTRPSARPPNGHASALAHDDEDDA
jgi:hypothetical protein